MTHSLTIDERFFYENAAFSYDPKRETKEDGHVRTAKKLALAEEWVRNAPNFWFKWGLDNTDEDNNYHYCCLMHHNKVVSSLSGIEFAEGAIPQCVPYYRVVEAELAWEAYPG